MPRRSRRPAPLARGGVAVGLATLLAAGGLAVAAPTTASAETSAPAADTPTIDYGALERQVAATLNAARQSPVTIADDLEQLKANREGSYLVMPDGYRFYAEPAYLDASIAEARQQPALRALAWSDKLAKLAKDQVPNGATQGHGNFGDRVKKAGISSGIVIEAIAPSIDPSPRAVVYTFWISNGEWSTASPFNPSATEGRGHRGIVNDHRMTQIGVGCGPLSPQDAERFQVTCIITAGVDIDGNGGKGASSNAVKKAKQAVAKAKKAVKAAKGKKAKKKAKKRLKKAKLRLKKAKQAG